MHGSVYEFGEAGLSETKIAAFTRDHGPQSIHIDQAESATSRFGKSIARGVHTVGACMRLPRPPRLPSGRPGLSRPRRAPLATPDATWRTLRIRATVTKVRA